MRHKKRGRQLGRDTQHRRALFRNLVTALLDAERIETTEPKGKEIRSITDKMITLAKSGTLADRRRAGAYIMRAEILKKLFDEIGPRYAAVNGGYTRLVKTRVRRGDGAPMVLIELSRGVAKSESLKPAEGKAAKPKSAEGAA
jgi:large subunit ribosomal protein L17